MVDVRVRHDDAVDVAQRDSCTLYDPRRFVIECAHGVRESISWRPNWPFYFRARDRGAKFFSRSHDDVIRVYDHAGNVIETHEHAGEFKEW